MMRLKQFIRSVIALALVYVSVLCASAFAMTHSVQGSALILSGEVVFSDLERAKKTLNDTPTITHVVLRNSMGGNSWTGYRLGELFRERGLTTVVSGHCVSSCSRLFLGGKQRLYSDDFPPSLTYVGFHGHYDFGELNEAAVKKNDLIAWTLRFTDGKTDRALIERWSRIQKRAGDVRFYPTQARATLLGASFYCAGDESRKPQRCETIATDALKQGIVTSAAKYSSPDARSLFFKQREASYPSTDFAALDDLKSNALARSGVRNEYQSFMKASLPRAFALSRDHAHAAWRGSSRDSAEAALVACAKKAGSACLLYAIDERVVYSRSSP